MARSFTADFKRFFGRGVAILLPSILTLWLLWQACTFVFTNVAVPINRVIRIGVIEVVELFPEEARPTWYTVTPEQVEARQAARQQQQLQAISAAQAATNIRRDRFRVFWEGHWYLEMTGLLIAIILLYLAGLLLSNFVGRSIYVRVERLIARIPGFKQIYPHVKQVVELVLGEKKMAFSKVVLVEYPSKDIWTIGFLTGESVRQIDDSAGEHVSTVFIPTSPTPFTGFTINVPRTRIRELDMTMEEALRFVITAGVLTPGSATNASPGSIPPATLAPAAPAPARDAAGENRRETA
ncbi:MAG: DUF502 domain-containing protein [Phycisphaerales bacterium]